MRSYLGFEINDGALKLSGQTEAQTASDRIAAVGGGRDRPLVESRESPSMLIGVLNLNAVISGKDADPIITNFTLQRVKKLRQRIVGPIVCCAPGAVRGSADFVFGDRLRRSHKWLPRSRSPTTRRRR